MITDKELTDKLQVLVNSDDQEESHVEADDILCAALIELGYTESVRVYRTIDKWFA